MREKARKLECSETKQQLCVQRSPRLAAKKILFVLSAERLSDYKNFLCFKNGEVFATLHERKIRRTNI